MVITGSMKLHFSCRGNIHLQALTCTNVSLILKSNALIYVWELRNNLTDEKHLMIKAKITKNSRIKCTVGGILTL